ncbi:MAG: metal ABC transporter ATP-binding protein [Desulfovibrionaceae bacterium]|nr:metal ABC transporter ATP-binding protein [Desulfovibrionaceae bacterium]
MNDTPALELTSVTFSYNGAPAVQDVNLRLPRGDYLAVLGPNGGGKTTLLRLILGLEQPSSGTVRVLGDDPRRARPRIGYLQQDAHGPSAFPISVLDTVLMGCIGSGRWRPTAADHALALESLSRVGMRDFAARRIGALSGGQRQRVFIARALASGPDLLLLDEPAASIDQEGRNTLFDFMAELHERGMTIVMVSHDISVVSRRVTSVACVNRTLHHHPSPEITYEMAKLLYGCEDGECPVDLIAHGLPHRVLASEEYWHKEAEAARRNAADVPAAASASTEGGDA